MAYPQVEQSQTTTNNSNSTSPSFNYPSSLTTGNLLICLFGTDGDNTVTWPSGWTGIFSYSRGTEVSLHAGWREVDGTEGSSFTVTLGEPDASFQ